MITIKSSKDIECIFNKGKIFHLSGINVITFHDVDKTIKGNIAFIAGKKQGNAVWRNKAKRRMRALYKDIDTQKKVLLIAKKDLLDKDFNSIKKEIIECLKK